MKRLKPLHALCSRLEGFRVDFVGRGKEPFCHGLHVVRVVEALVHWDVGGVAIFRGVGVAIFLVIVVGMGVSGHAVRDLLVAVRVDACGGGGEICLLYLVLTKQF